MTQWALSDLRGVADQPHRQHRGRPHQRNLTAAIVDRAGAYFGAQTAPLIIFTAEPGRTVQIPLLVGTDSCSPDLGYAVPAGEWRVVAPLDLADGKRLVSPPLPLTVID